MTADGATTVEALQAELARAKEQPRLGNAAALKAAEELRAEKAAHGECWKKMANMAVELKATVNHCRALEKENQAKASDLEKAAATKKDLRSAMRAKKEELREAGEILYVAEEVRRSTVCPSGSAVEFGGCVYGFGGERCRCGQILPESDGP